MNVFIKTCRNLCFAFCFVLLFLPCRVMAQEYNIISYDDLSKTESFGCSVQGQDFLYLGYPWKTMGGTVSYVYLYDTYPTFNLGDRFIAIDSQDGNGYRGKSLSIYYNVTFSDPEHNPNTYNLNTTENTSIKAYSIAYLISAYESGNFDSLVTGTSFLSANWSPQFDLDVWSTEALYRMLAFSEMPEDPDAFIDGLTESNANCSVRSLTYDKDTEIASYDILYPNTATSSGYYIKCSYASNSDNRVVRSVSKLFTDGSSSYYVPSANSGTYLRLIHVIPYYTYKGSTYRGYGKQLWFNSSGSAIDPDSGLPIDISDDPINIVNFKVKITDTSHGSQLACSWQVKQSDIPLNNWVYDLTVSGQRISYNNVIDPTAPTTSPFSHKFVQNGRVDSYSVTVDTSSLSASRDVYIAKKIYLVTKFVNGGRLYKGNQYVYDLDSGLWEISTDTPPGNEYGPDADIDPDGGTSTTPINPVGGDDVSIPIDTIIDIDDITGAFASIKDLVGACIASVGSIPRLISTVFSFLPSIYITGFTALIAFSLLVGFIRIIK